MMGSWIDPEVGFSKDVMEGQSQKKTLANKWIMS